MSARLEFVADKGQVRPGYSLDPLIVRKDLVDSGKAKTLKDLKSLSPGDSLGELSRPP